MSYFICDNGHINAQPDRCTVCGSAPLETSPSIEVLCRQILGNKCPQCGWPINPDRLGGKCLDCGAVFHRDAGGLIVLGERDSPEFDRRAAPGSTVRRASWENLREDIEQLRDDAMRRHELATQSGDERTQALYSAASAAYDAALAAMRRRAVDLPTVSKYAHGYVHLLEALKALDQDETPEDEQKITDPLRDIMDDVWWAMTPEEIEARTTARGPIPRPGGKS
jgi:hypothetical protein